MSTPVNNKSTLSIIVAIARNGAIGKENKLLWHISEDLKYFKQITQGSPVIMGYNTWLSIGKPLPNRRNIVLCRFCGLQQPPQKDSIPGVEIFTSLEDALRETAGEREVFIIGGGEIYRQTLPLADKLYITHVHVDIEDADTFFPDIDSGVWSETFRESHLHGKEFPHPFDFVVYQRR